MSFFLPLVNWSSPWSRMSSFHGFPTQFRLNWTHVGMEVKLQDGPGFSEVSQRFLRIRGHPPSGFPRMLLDHLSQTEKQSRSMAGAQLLPEILSDSALPSKSACGFQRPVPFSSVIQMFLTKYSAKWLYCCCANVKEHSSDPSLTMNELSF